MIYLIGCCKNKHQMTQISGDCVWKLSCRPTVFEKSKCFAVSMFDERVFPYSPQGGFRYFKGHFRTRWCLRCVFCSVMHHCVVRRSGSVPTEITEPARRLDRPGTYSSKHCKVKTSWQAYWSAAISRSQPSGCILLRSQKSYWKPCHIRSRLGIL